MFIIILGQHVSIPIESSSGPSKIQILYLRRPEDDSVRIEIYWPCTIISIINYVLQPAFGYHPIPAEPNQYTSTHRNRTVHLQTVASS